MQPITEELLSKFRENVAADPMVRPLHAAMSKTSLDDVAFLPLEAAKLEGPFTVEVKTRGIMNQKRSGRCWFFATMNILREVVAEKLNLPEFKLSGNYITFFDKLEKANNFLENIIRYADEPLTSRMSEYLIHGIGDGGYWDQAVDLVQKYGVVPESVMPETFQAENTAALMKVLNKLLKKDAGILRRMLAAGEDVAATKEAMLSEIFKALCIAFGTPVETFDFVYRDKDENYAIDRNLTPKAFYDKYIGIDFNDYITITNEPTDRVPLNTPYSFHFMGNMIENDCLHFNLPYDEFRALAVAQLKDKEPVWFVCDSDQSTDRKMGIWDPASFAYGEMLGGLDLEFSKEDRLNYRDTHGCHAMALVGVNFGADGAPDRWKIENSWGAENGKSGYFVCSEKYFADYALQVIINKKHLSSAQLALLEKEPVRLDPWMNY